jgi:hypothetical protein
MNRKHGKGVRRLSTFSHLCPPPKAPTNTLARGHAQGGPTTTAVAVTVEAVRGAVVAVAAEPWR